MPRVFYEDEDDDNKHACSNIQVETIIGRDAVKLELKNSLQDGYAEKLAKCCGPLMFANAENLMDELEKCREQLYSSFSYDTSGKRTQFFFTTLKNFGKLKGFMFGALVVGGVGLKDAKVLQIDYLCGCSSKCELCGHKYKSGTELINEAKRIAKQFGATEIQVESVKESVGFYKKLHFKPIVNDNVDEKDLYLFLCTQCCRKRSKSTSKSTSRSRSRSRSSTSRSPSKSPKRLKKFPENATEKELQEYYEYMTK